MNDSNTTQQGPNLIAKLLGRQSPGPAQEIRAALAELNQRRAAIERRLAAIQRETPINGGAGPERKRALTTGTPSEIVELDQEIASLRAELEQQLPAQESALRQRLDEAEQADARDRLPDRLKALPKALDRHAKAEAALSDARAAVDAEVSNIITDRRKYGDDAPGVTAAQAEHIARIRGIAEEPASPYRYSYPKASVFSALGAPLPERARKGYDPLAKSPADHERVTDEELARQPEQGFWNKREPGQPRRPLES